MNKDIESQSDFLLGDVVKYIREHFILSGRMGVVVEQDRLMLLVDWICNKSFGHDGCGKTHEGKGWWVDREDLKLIWRTA